MVLESLITPMSAEKRPWQMIILGILFTLFGVFLGIKIFKGQASIVAVFFVSIASVPIIYNTLRLEEEKDEKITDEVILVKEHYKALKAFMFLFIGATIAFSFVYIMTSAYFPDSHTIIFKVQSDTISSINGNLIKDFEDALLTGNTVTPDVDISGSALEGAMLNDVTGEAMGKSNHLMRIILNNIKVCLYCVLFSFLYGVGAIFILTWNASVIGTAIGSFIVTRMNAIAGTDLGILGGAAATSKIYSCAFLIRYLPHGIPEIASYFVAAIAGGIISVAIVKHRFGTRKFENIIVDSSVLLLIALFLVIISGFIEVYFTPALFGTVC